MPSNKTTSPSISVLLIGASGTLGRELLTELSRQQSNFARVAILASDSTKALSPFFRNAANPVTAGGLGIEVITGSLLSPSTYNGFTHVISCVGNALMASQPAIIDAAVAAGVSHFYPSEWNSDIAQPEVAQMRYFRDKQATRAHLAAVARETPGFVYTIMITGIFTEWSVLPLYGFDHEKFKAEIYGRPDARVGVTSMRDICEYTVSSLLLPFKANSASTNPSERTIRVQGSSQPFSALIAALGKARGREYEVTYRDPALAAEQEEKARISGDEAGEVLWSIRPLVASGHGVADGAGALDNELFDFEPEGLDEVFERTYQGERWR